MNIFEQYGIKEVADVVLYSIELDENDDEIYIPVMYLDTLKVSTIEETAEQVSARGGLGNSELIIWDYGKEITVNLEDALYTPASQGMTWGGKYGTKKFKLYGITNSGEKGEIMIDNFSGFGVSNSLYSWTCDCIILLNNGDKYYKKNQSILYNKTNTGHSWSFSASRNSKTINLNSEISFTLVEEWNDNITPPQEVVYQIDSSLGNVYYLDRMEKCKATQRFAIDTDVNLTHSQHRYLERYAHSELTVFIDPKTMMPFEPNTNVFTRSSGQVLTGNLREIKQHEIYYKWTRTKATQNSSLGHQIIVDATHFPGTYRLVGETYSRSRETGKDQRFQFEIPLCKMGTNNNLTLQADGDPTTFNMTLKVLRKEDGTMMKLTQYKVDSLKVDSVLSGSTNVITDSQVVRDNPFEENIKNSQVAPKVSTTNTDN